MRRGQKVLLERIREPQFVLRAHEPGAIKSVGQLWLPERGCVRLRTGRSSVPAFKALTESRTFERAAAGADTQQSS
jgi:hypothetical protein